MSWLGGVHVNFHLVPGRGVGASRHADRGNREVCWHMMRVGFKRISKAVQANLRASRVTLTSWGLYQQLHSDKIFSGRGRRSIPHVTEGGGIAPTGGKSPHSNGAPTDFVLAKRNCPQPGKYTDQILTVRFSARNRLGTRACARTTCKHLPITIFA